VRGHVMPHSREIFNGLAVLRDADLQLESGYFWPVFKPNTRLMNIGLWTNKNC